MRTEDGRTIRLKDYRAPDFRVSTVALDVVLEPGQARVVARLRLERGPGVATDRALVLDGDGLELTRLELGGAPLPASAYEATPERLTIATVPATGAFELSIETRLKPEENTALSGLYRSNGIWCTQCEAEGFRRITYFPDRPDVLSLYRVRIEAAKGEAPVLLSNGNLVEAGDLADGRHFAVWEDPFPKPSYLFALVAGDLERLGDTFTTASGREVELGIFTERGRSAPAGYAMDALKRSMIWDERRFGREYDLDVFNIVAISDFNMGAMENKGLNVFNHKYVLLDPQTATDADYAGVETVIAHEYFHNWTGNRITCRDWFQLCLKEGLTVYRDQEFTADERSRGVQRIGAVRRLTALQFPEDQGPLQHPVRPQHYKEINNFYTATVYDKGAELVRMLATLLGEDAFRAGMDRYFERFDGTAATMEDFLGAFAETSGRDLSQFALWYDQAGTPELAVREAFDAPSGTLTVTLTQSLARGAAGTGTAPFHMPVLFGLVSPSGEDLTPANPSGRAGLAEVTAPETVMRFAGLKERPVLSVLRDFSAPVVLRHEQSEADRLVLAARDPNLFNRWRALNDLVGDELRRLTGANRAGRTAEIDGRIAATMIDTAGDERLEPAFRALALALPPESEIARSIGRDVDPAAIHAASESARVAIGRAGLATFERLAAAPADGPFSPDARAAGARALSLAALGYLSAATGDNGPAARRYEMAGNMTDRFGALAILVQRFAPSAACEAALADFHRRFEDDELVMDKWFALQAASPREETLDRVKALTEHRQFSLKNPNRVRALLGGLATNPIAFNRPDGAGYRFYADRLEALDKLNPQIAARLATAFRSWRTLEPRRQSAVEETLDALLAKAALSIDLKDILERTRS
ncbi:aminopeptidase N [Aurantimonas sp. Leaf443]|uniref:aminopeptidase N n=1 Tax=Aurantimonas sp. Leaf443 TaxID=1736378 RepID=UPI000700716D|nr:aminopeptidase N [Aurantimonas sp. Leaf443]KQT88254.1 aminopeptidase [Aurantimonas sp. Leaf443]